MPPIEHLQRVPQLALDRLERQGLFTTGLFLEVSETPTRRMYLADQIGVTINDINDWRDEALLLNLADFGPEQQRILTQARIIGLADAAGSDPRGVPRAGRERPHSRSASRPLRTSPSRAGTSRPRRWPRTEPGRGPATRQHRRAQRRCLEREPPRHPHPRPAASPPRAVPPPDPRRLRFRAPPGPGRANRSHGLSDRSVVRVRARAGHVRVRGTGRRSRSTTRAERDTCADARALLWLCLVGRRCSRASASRWSIARPRDADRASVWRAVSRAGAATASCRGDRRRRRTGRLRARSSRSSIRSSSRAADWSFDATSQRLVQLYPFAFWQLVAAAFGVLVLVLGAWRLVAGPGVGATRRGRAERRPDAAARRPLGSSRCPTSVS